MKTLRSALPEPIKTFFRPTVRRIYVLLGHLRALMLRSRTLIVQLGASIARWRVSIAQSIMQAMGVSVMYLQSILQQPVARFTEWPRAITRVRRDFRQRHGVSPHLLRPQTFSEKVQWRKLFDLNPQFVVFSDKLRVRDFICERAGPSALAPLLWVGDDPDAVPFQRFKVPYVVKSTHASGQTLIITDTADFDVGQARALMKAWLSCCYACGLVVAMHVLRRSRGTLSFLDAS
jgi:hypothetical protein